MIKTSTSLHLQFWRLVSIERDTGTVIVVAKAVKIADVKYPPSQGYHHTWCFDHSCGHTAFAEDALIASKMNKGPGGKQPKMRDTVWNGQPQTMTLPDGRPKGAALVLEERGFWRREATTQRE